MSVRKIFLILAALAFWPAVVRADCLTDGHTRVVPSVKLTAANTLNPADNTVYDLSSVGTFHETDPDYPMKVVGGKNICVHGMNIGTVAAWNIPWDDWKRFHDGTALEMEVIGDTTHIAENIYSFGAMDGFRPTTDRLGGSAKWILRHSYFRVFRDDAVENDHCLTGLIDDVLFDYGYGGYSQRPGKNAHWTCNSDNHNVFTITNTLVSEYCLAFHSTGADSHINHGDCPKPSPGDPYNTYTAQKGGVSNIYKMGGKNGPYHTSDSIFYVSHVSVSGPKDMDFPTRPEDTYSNVTVVWTGGGDYPGVLPKSGVKVTSDLSVWTTARTKWLHDHGCPDVDRAGCTWSAGDDPLPPDVSTISLLSDRVKITETRPADFVGNQFWGSDDPGATVDTATPIGSPTTQNFLLLSDIPVDDVVIFAKEKDNAGQFSANAVSIAVNLAPPPDVTSIAQQTTNMACVATKPKDFGGFQFRAGAVLDADWSAVTDVGSLQTKCAFPIASLPVGTQRVCVKEVDTGGLFSANAACVNVSLLPPTATLGLTTIFATVTPAVSGGGPTTATVTMTRAGSTTLAATANVRMTGRTGAPVVGADLTGAPATLPDAPLTVAAGSTTANRTFSFAAQNLLTDHGGTIDIYNPVNATLAGTTTFDFTLVHNNTVALPTLAFSTTFSTVTPHVAGGGVFTVPYVITRSGDTTSAATVFVQMTGRGGSPVVGADLSPTGLPDIQVTIPAGQATVSRNFVFVGQNLFTDHAGTVTLHDPASATLAGTSTFDFTLLHNSVVVDDPPPDVAAVTADTVAREMNWVPPTVQASDFFGYYMRAGTTVTADWDASADIGSPRVTAYTLTSFPFASLPADTKRFCVKELDNAKQESVNAVCANVPIDSPPPDQTAAVDVGDRIVWSGPLPSDFKGFEVGTAPDGPSVPPLDEFTFYPGLRDSTHNYITKTELATIDALWIVIFEVDQADQRSSTGLFFHKLPDIDSPCGKVTPMAVRDVRCRNQN